MTESNNGAKKDYLPIVTDSICLAVECNAYRLRKTFAERLITSDWSDIIEFVDDYKYCRIVRNYTQKAYYVRKNRQFRKHINRYLNDTTRQDQ